MALMGLHLAICKKLHKKLKQKALEQDKTIKAFLTELIEKAV